MAHWAQYIGKDSLGFRPARAVARTGYRLRMRRGMPLFPRPPLLITEWQITEHLQSARRRIDQLPPPAFLTGLPQRCQQARSPVRGMDPHCGRTIT